jgi:uncharacterized protein YprB with RNaseH-like and TPR domain
VSTRLRERLDRAGRTHRQHGAGTATRDASGLADVLGGKLISPSVLRVETRHPRLSGPGRLALEGERPAAAFLGHPSVGETGRIVFFDTETTGLAGGTGTVVFMVGLAWFDEGDLLLRQYLMTAFGGETALLQAVTTDLANARLLVSFNGKSFDATQLETRYRLAGLPSPLHGPEHLDLLFHVRRLFGRSWPNCRLATAERALLDFERRNDLPGSMAPMAWLEWLRSGRSSMLKGVAEHNRWDLISLAGLLPAIGARYRDNQAGEVDHAATADWLLGAHGIDTAMDFLLRHRDNLDIRGRNRLACLSRRIGNWTLAVEIWQELARGGNGHAIEELAKYFEHRVRDYRRALQCVDTLLALDHGSEAHRRRQQRLLGKFDGYADLG